MQIKKSDAVLEAFHNADERARAQVERNAQDVAKAADDARSKYKETIVAVVEVLAAELCKAIDADKRSIELGEWYQPYHYHSKITKATFKPKEGSRASVLIPLFEQAAQEEMMDEFCKALEEVLNSACDGRVRLVRHNILRQMVKPIGREPRHELISLAWRIS